VIAGHAFVEARPGGLCAHQDAGQAHTCRQPRGRHRADLMHVIDELTTEEAQEAMRLLVLLGNPATRWALEAIAIAVPRLAGEARALKDDPGGAGPLAGATNEQLTARTKTRHGATLDALKEYDG
jgi:hypothetical protein